MKRIGSLVVASACVVCMAASITACGTRRPALADPTPPAPPAALSTPATTAPAPPLPAPVPVVEVVAPQPQPAVPSGCALVDDAAVPVTSIGVTERIDPSHAPHPNNESERLVFRQLYETLVRADCEGRLWPGLASSWRLDTDGRTWLVTLRGDARFSDGTPVSAATVRESWASDDNANDLNNSARRLVTSAVAIDERTLAIVLRNSATGDPLALAHTDLAVARHSPGSAWPLGTLGVATPQASPAVAGAERVLTLDRSGLPPLRVLIAPRDPRDLLDTPLDLLLTRDPQTLAYAATRPEFLTVPLEWHRTQVLLPLGLTPPPVPHTAEDRQRFANDAIRGESRGATGPFWWESTDACEGIPNRTPAPTTPASRIVYDSTDITARELAERLVAVAATSYPRAVPFSGEALQQTMHRGSDSGYVMSVERLPLDRCRELAVAMERAPWLDRTSIVPISDTRLYAIVRRGKGPLIADRDGGLALSTQIVRATP